MKQVISRIRGWMKKPASKAELYLGIVLPWWCAGIMLAISVVFLLAVPWFGVLALAVTIAMMYWCYNVDKKRGYIDVIHHCYLQARQLKEARVPDPESPHYSQK